MGILLCGSRSLRPVKTGRSAILAKSDQNSLKKVCWVNIAEAGVQSRVKYRIARYLILIELFFNTLFEKLLQFFQFLFVVDRSKDKAFVFFTELYDVKFAHVVEYIIAAFKNGNYGKYSCAVCVVDAVEDLEPNILSVFIGNGENIGCKRIRVKHLRIFHCTYIILLSLSIVNKQSEGKLGCPCKIENIFGREGVYRVFFRKIVLLFPGIVHAEPRFDADIRSAGLCP